MKKSLLKVSSFALLLGGWLCACQDDQIVDQKVSLDHSNTIQLVEITDNNEVIPVTSTRGNVGSASNLAQRRIIWQHYEILRGEIFQENCVLLIRWD